MNNTINKKYKFKYTKNFTSDDQIKFLLDKGVKIKNINDAKMILKTLGFNRINTYLECCKNSKTNSNITFEQLVELNNFDFELNNLLFHIVNKIEMTLRNSLTDAFNLYQDCYGIYNPNVYKNKDFYFQTISGIYDTLSHNHDNDLKEKICLCDGLMPVYIFVENITFGNLIKLVKNLREVNNLPGNYLIKMYRKKSSPNGEETFTLEVLCSMFNSINLLRNSVCHLYQLYNKTFQANIVYPNKTTKEKLKLFDIILAMKYLLISKDDYIEFLDSLFLLFDKYKEYIDVKDLGFLGNYKAILYFKD